LSRSAALEALWTDAWSELAELTADDSALLCFLPDGQLVPAEICRGWLQDSVDEGWRVRVSAGWVLGKPGVIASRWRED
jgi:hypothetical protein